MKRTLFCFAQSETARPTFDRNVPEIRATFSDATSSCACFWASAGWPLSSRKITSILRPSTPPFALTSSTAISTACRRSEEHTSELQSHSDLVCRLLLEKKKKTRKY